MRLVQTELNAVTGLIHYLNEKFDGHGLIARVYLHGLEPIEPGGPEPDKGMISVADREEDADGKALLTYAWGTGDD